MSNNTNPTAVTAQTNKAGQTPDTIIPTSHPHADQRNWMPGDTDDDDDGGNPDLRRRFQQHVLRTLERMREWPLLPPEILADLIFPHVSVAQIVEAHLYLEKIARCIDKKMREGKWKCAECGKDVWAKIKLTKDGLKREYRYVRRDAHYCSQACRQKAFRKRKRVTATPSDTAAELSRRDGFPIVQNELG